MISFILTTDEAKTAMQLGYYCQDNLNYNTYHLVDGDYVSIHSGNRLPIQSWFNKHALWRIVTP